MKYLTILLIFATQITYAQDSTVKKTTQPFQPEKPSQMRGEVNIGFVNLFESQSQYVLPYAVNAGPYYDSNGDVVYNTAPNYYYQQLNTNNYTPGFGLGYKLHFDDKNAFRVSVNLGYEKLNQTLENNIGQFVNNLNTYNSTTDVDISQVSFGIRMGYEKNIRLGEKASGFIGFDAFADYRDNTNITTIENTYTTTPNFGPQSGLQTQKTESVWDETIMTIGAAPFLGVRYFLTKQLSLSIESRLEVSQATAESKTSNDQNLYTTDVTEKAFGIKGRPLGFFSVNMHF